MQKKWPVLIGIVILFTIAEIFTSGSAFAEQYQDCKDLVESCQGISSMSSKLTFQQKEQRIQAQATHDLQRLRQGEVQGQVKGTYRLEVGTEHWVPARFMAVSRCMNGSDVFESTLIKYRLEVSALLRNRKHSSTETGLDLPYSTHYESCTVARTKRIGALPIAQALNLAPTAPSTPARVGSGAQ